MYTTGRPVLLKEIWRFQETCRIFGLYYSRKFNFSSSDLLYSVMQGLQELRTQLEATVHAIVIQPAHATNFSNCKSLQLQCVVIFSPFCIARVQQGMQSG